MTIGIFAERLSGRLAIQDIECILSPSFADGLVQFAPFIFREPQYQVAHLPAFSTMNFAPHLHVAHCGYGWLFSSVPQTHLMCPMGIVMA